MIPLPGILEELLQYGERKSWEQQAAKALHVANKCRRTGRNALASRIDVKYNRYYPKSDLAIAFGLMLAAQNKQL